MPEQIKVNWKTIRERAGRPYPQEAFQFVRDGLAHTVSEVHGECASTERHVRGQELCLGLRDYAVRQYGLLARTVLARWGIESTDDFGRIVYAMIDAGLMRQSEQDSIDDFRCVYDFAEAFAVVEVA